MGVQFSPEAIRNSINSASCAKIFANSIQYGVNKFPELPWWVKKLIEKSVQKECSITG